MLNPINPCINFFTKSLVVILKGVCKSDLSFRLASPFPITMMQTVLEFIVKTVVNYLCFEMTLDQGTHLKWSEVGYCELQIQPLS